MTDQHRHASDDAQEPQKAGQAPLPPRIEDIESVDTPEGFERVLDRLLAIQRPVVVARIRQLRRQHPDESPVELVKRLERDYRNAVTLSGGAVGAAAAVPGVGTVTSATITGVETAAFLEVTALYGQAIAELHGIATNDPTRARTLVMSLMLGDSAKKLVRQFAGQLSGKQVLDSSGRQAFWGELIAKSMPASLMGELAKQIRKSFTKKVMTRVGAGSLGRIIPFGIGAVVGGTGNRLLANRVIETSHSAFGPLPSGFHRDLTVEPGTKQSSFMFFRPVIPTRKHKEIER